MSAGNRVFTLTPFWERLNHSESASCFTDEQANEGNWLWKCVLFATKRIPIKRSCKSINMIRELTNLIFFFSVWTFYSPGKGPSPGGMKSVPRILPSLTGILFTPSAMYHFWNVTLDKGCSEDSFGVTWSSKQFKTMLYGLVTSDFISRVPFLCPGAGFMLHNNPIGETPL